MMPGMKFNKIFAALLIAGIVAMLGGFVAKGLVHADAPAKPGFVIEAAEAAGAGAGASSAPKGPEPVLGLIAAANAEQGQKLAKACAACHTFEKGGANRVGPNLWGVVNAAKAHHQGFAYSSAMAGKGGSWNYDALNHFLFKPKDFVPGTKMTYAGLKKPEDRAALIAYLRTLADSPAGLPSEAEIRAEAEAFAPPTATQTPAAAPAPDSPVPGGAAPVPQVPGSVPAPAPNGQAPASPGPAPAAP